MHPALPPFMFSAGVALVLVLVACTALSLSGGGSSLITIVAETPATSDMESGVRLNWDTVFTGGATIFGLVVFGTVLSALFKRSTEPPYGRWAVRMLVVGAAVAAVASWAIMYAACCSYMVEAHLMYLMFVLLAGAVLVMLGHARIMDVIEKRWRAAQENG